MEDYPDDTCHRQQIRCIAITDLIIGFISICLGLAGIACLPEILDLFEIKNEHLRLGAWIVSLMMNILHLTAALSLFLSSSSKSDTIFCSSIQLSNYWLSMSMILIVMLSIQFFFSFRSSIPILIFYLTHIIFRSITISKLHSHIQKMENFTRTIRGDSRFTTKLLLKVPSMSLTTNSLHDPDLHSPNSYSRSPSPHRLPSSSSSRQFC